jgi:Leu/Phe-tRNA-protein transferase
MFEIKQVDATQTEIVISANIDPAPFVAAYVGHFMAVAEKQTVRIYLNPEVVIPLENMFRIYTAIKKKRKTTQIKIDNMTIYIQDKATAQCCNHLVFLTQCAFPVHVASL